MYLDFFKLSRKPFSLVPSANGCILVPSLKHELNRCLEAIDESRCPVMIAAPSGCGKSIMLALIENHFAREIRTIRLDCASLTSRIELIQSMLGEMGLRFGSESVGELRLRMIDFLKSSEHCPNGLLLLVDEAQMLTDEVLEELRLMTNLVCAGRSQVRLVMAGTLAMEENVSRKESFNQRISIRSYPRAMPHDETMLFVLAQMQLAGRDGREVFQPSALEKIHAFSGGVPRVICQLTDNALRFAAREKHATINGSVIEASWYDLQQLPPPESHKKNSSTNAGADTDGIIEFGSLTDESPLKSNRAQPAASAVDSFSQESTPFSPGNQLDSNDQDLNSNEMISEHEHSSDDGFLVADTGAHTEVDDTLQSLLQQLDEYEIAENARAGAGSRPGSGGAGGTKPSDDVPENRTDRRKSDSAKTVDSSQVFGSDFELEEDVVDIQSLRIASQNRMSARTSSKEVTGIVEPDESPAWTPVGNEIVFPFGQDSQMSDDVQEEGSSDIESKPAASHLSPKADSSTKLSDRDRDSDDDRDIIIVQDTKKPKQEARADEKASTATPASPAPTGNAIRMNYQELFRQLRNNTDVEQ